MAERKSQGFFIGLRAGRWIMSIRPKRYKVSAVIKFSVDDIIARTRREAKQTVKDAPGDNAEFASRQGTVEILEIDAEPIALVSKEEYEEEGGEDRFDEPWNPAWDKKPLRANPSARAAQGPNG
jgi:hypothetical protein